MVLQTPWLRLCVEARLLNKRHVKKDVVVLFEFHWSELHERRMFPRLSRLTQGDSDSRCTLKIKSWPCEVVGKDMVKKKEGEVRHGRCTTWHGADLSYTKSLNAPDSWQPWQQPQPSLHPTRRRKQLKTKSTGQLSSAKTLSALASSPLTSWIVSPPKRIEDRIFVKIQVCEWLIQIIP